MVYSWLWLVTLATCLVHRSDEFECQGQKSKVKVTRDKKRAVHSQRPHGMDEMECFRCRWLSCKQQTWQFDRCRGVSLPGCVHWAWWATAGLCHAFLVVVTLFNGNMHERLEEASHFISCYWQLFIHGWGGSALVVDIESPKLTRRWVNRSRTQCQHLCSYMQ